MVTELPHPPEKDVMSSYLEQLAEFEAQTKAFGFVCVKSEHAVPQEQVPLQSLLYQDP